MSEINWFSCSTKCVAFIDVCLLEDVSSYKYITNGNVSVTGSGDEELYRQLIEALRIMGIDNQDILSMKYVFLLYNALQWQWSSSVT